MRVETFLTLTLVPLFLSAGFAQQPPAEPSSAALIEPQVALANGTSEWMLTAGPAWGVSLLHSVAGHDYLLQSVSWGRILTDPIGPGALRGRFQWAVEVVPLYGQYAPEKTYGVGLTPIVWRWNFERRGRLSTYAELAGGGLWTQDPVPQRTTTANFTAHLAYGVRYFIRPQQAFVASYRFHHISNGNRLESNPGVNAHVLQFGWTLLRPRA
ncbi:MAG: acyloxyacyl hydrolase [Acidobacteria bacterium]|nr:acyloxyacyl hydrolase [Acidobacteriota bacterium]